MIAEYLFHHCYFSHHAKSMPLLVYYAFRIKVIVEAEAVENSSVIHRELKMCAKMGRFTPKCPERDKQAMERFSQQSDQIFYL